jgi:hypothetical protein
MNWVKTQIKTDQLILDLSVDYHALNPLDAGIYTVNYIVKNYPPPYTLMLSGGVDSQSMLWAWHKSGHKFNTISAKYNHDMNYHDLKTLEEFSLKYQIPMTFIEFDLLDFLENDYDEWANRYDCSSPQICTYMKLASLITDGTRIFSGNYINSNHANPLSLDYAILGIERFSKISNTSIVPFFLLETPELAYSFDNILKQVPSDDFYKWKVNTYQQSGYPVIPQETKLTGFEKVKDYYDQHYKHLVTTNHKLMITSNPSRRVFDLLLRHPYERKLKHPKLKFILNDKSC